MAARAGWTGRASWAPTALAALTLFTPPSVQAQAPDGGDWLLRLRTLHLNPGIHDTIGLDVSVTPLDFTELDISWFLRPQWAVEFALTVPQRHSVRSGGFEVGQLKQLPPTLMLQYHVTGYRWRPYVGAGINYTLVDNLRFSPDVSPLLQATVRNHSIAGVIGLGIDVPFRLFERQWVFNLDVKRMQLKTNLDSVDPIFGTFSVNPVLTSAGIGLRF